jgi:hypothetical protein
MRGQEVIRRMLKRLPMSCQPSPMTGQETLGDVGRPLSGLFGQAVSR